MRSLLVILLLSVSITAQYVVYGRVTDQDGRGIAQVDVEVRGFACMKPVHVETNAKGGYSVPVPACYAITVNVQHPDFIASLPNTSIFLYPGGGRADFVLFH